MRQVRLIEKAGLPTAWPTLDEDAVLTTLRGDKKSVTENAFCAPPIGEVVIRDDINDNDVRNAWRLWPDQPGPAKRLSCHRAHRDPHRVQSQPTQLPQTTGIHKTQQRLTSTQGLIQLMSW